MICVKGVDLTLGFLGLLLDVSPKTADRNNIISVYFHPSLTKRFDERKAEKKKILQTINDNFGCNLSEVT